MSRLQTRIIPHILKWVPLMCPKNHFISSSSYLYVSGPRHIMQHLRFGSTESSFILENGGNLVDQSKKERLVRKEAQAALLEYFYATRSLPFMDAENMSKNSPTFLEKLLSSVQVGDADVGHSLSRFLRYHPISEFEPFFESIGLKPSEYMLFLPQKLMFLNDDQLLLENYQVLCNYGVARNRIGRIYREAKDVFGYDYGVLASKLQSFQNLGLRHSLVIKVIISSPHLLIGNIDRDFVEVLEMLKKEGVEYEWLEEHLCLDDSYDWKWMLQSLCLLCDLGFIEGQLGQILTLHPDILLKRSGRITFCLFGFLLKFGTTLSNVQTVFLQFPQMSIVKFTNNLLGGYKFLIKINMYTPDICRIICCHSTVLGSCQLKSVATLLNSLNCGHSRLCQMVKDDPSVLKKWVLGVKVDRLQQTEKVVNVRKLKTKFLLSLGFVKKSSEMEQALKKVRGKAEELQPRFDCLVKNGLSREDVVQMLKLTPHILNQNIEVIQAKFDLIVKELGFPLSELVAYPKLLSYTIDRVKLRTLMYKWLKAKGVLPNTLSVSTILATSEEKFVVRYVNSHPKGHEHWKRLMKRVYSE